MSPQQSKVHVYSKWFIYHKAIFRLYLSYPGNDLSCRTHPTHYIILALYVCIACLCLFLMLVECFVCTITYTWSNTNYDCETKGNEKNTKIFSLMLRFFFCCPVLFVFFFKRSMTMVVAFHKLPSFSTISFQPNFSQHTISCCVIKEIIMKKSDLIDFSYNVDLWCRWRYARSPRWVYTSRKVNLRRFFCLFFDFFFFHQNSILDSPYR